MIDFIAYWLVRGCGVFFRALPIKIGLVIAGSLGWLLAFTQIRVAQAYANIKAAFPGRFTGSEIRRIIRRNYMNMFQNLVEMFWFPKMDEAYMKKYLSVPHANREFEAKRAGKGTILLTAHFGNWELENIWTSCIGMPLLVLVRDQKMKRLNQYLTQLRESHGSRMVSKGMELREIIRGIHHNELIGLLGDQQGGKTGVPIRFMGRMTTAPAGPIQIPMRTGAKVIPVFIVRENGPYHTLCHEEELRLERTGDEEKDLQINMQRYISILENFITRYPDQWHWLHKRWKHNWTKRILILSDGKAGHLVQSKAIFEILKKFEASNSRYEFPCEILEIQYRNVFAKRFFPIFAFFLMPFIQGRLNWLKPWFEPETYKNLEHIVADIVISCGASVLPLNYILKRECLAKNVVIMKPSFPFSLFQADLNLVPEHDQVKETEKVVSTRVAPSLICMEVLKSEGETLRKSLNLNHQYVVSVFLGGKTKAYDFNQKLFDEFLTGLDQVMEKKSFELLITTSRRTGSEFEQQLKKKFSNHKRVPLLVIANENNPEGIVTRMMGASDVLVISEDSISMISEGVTSGKSVIVLRLGKSMLARKHYRFQKFLEDQGVLRIATSSNLREVLEEELGQRKNHIEVNDTQKIQERLKSLL